MLLVDDDDAQLAERHEDREARAQDDACGPGLGAQPRGGALALAELAVRDGHRDAGEAAAHACLELRREADLGHQEKRLAAAGENLVDEAQIDLGLAAARHAVQEHRMESIGARKAHLQRVPLVLGERRRHLAVPGRGFHVAETDGTPADLAQARRKARRDHFAQAALVVGSAKAQHFEVALGDRGHVGDDPLDLLQARGGNRAPGCPGHHDADLAGAPERHDDERPGRRIHALREREIERLVERNVEGHARDLHARERPLRPCRKGCG